MEEALSIEIAKEATKDDKDSRVLNAIKAVFSKPKRLGKRVQVSFYGSDLVGISGTKIKLWKDAKYIRLTCNFYADQKKYYKERFKNKITYVKSEVELQGIV